MVRTYEGIRFSSKSESKGTRERIGTGGNMICFGHAIGTFVLPGQLQRPYVGQPTNGHKSRTVSSNQGRGMPTSKYAGRSVDHRPRLAHCPMARLTRLQLTTPQEIEHARKQATNTITPWTIAPGGGREANAKQDRSGNATPPAPGKACCQTKRTRAIQDSRACFKRVLGGHARPGDKRKWIICFKVEGQLFNNVRTPTPGRTNINIWGKRQCAAQGVTRPSRTKGQRFVS